MSETLAWIDALYGKCSPHDGEIILIDSSKRKTLSSHRVGSGRALVEAAKAMDGNVGAYIKINLMDADALRERSRREGKGRFIVGNAREVKTIVSFHLDVDAGKSSKYHSRGDMLEILDRMPRHPTLIINSDGRDGGFHAYWILREPYRIQDEDDRQRISELATRWQNRLNQLAGGKLDSTANIDRVLRVVGQPRQNGNLVSCHSYDPDREYSIEDLTLPKPKNEIRANAEREAKRILRAVLPERFEQTDKPITDYINATGLAVEDLFSAAGWTGKPNGDWIRPGSESGAKTARIATEHERPGANFFSGNEARFPCEKRDGGVGRYHPVEKIFVELRFAGDWKAAASWCAGQMSASVDLSRLKPNAKGAA